jgi:ubiquitin-protein ligase
MDTQASCEVPLRTLHKRLKWELKELQKKHHVCYNVKNTVVVHINPSMCITMQVDSRYPFLRPRTVLINGLDYHRALMGTRCFDNRCLCCSSILCEWSPGYTLELLLNEITTNYAIKKHRVWEIFANVVQRAFVAPVCIRQYL